MNNFYYSSLKFNYKKKKKKNLTQKKINYKLLVIKSETLLFGSKKKKNKKPKYFSKIKTFIVSDSNAIWMKIKKNKCRKKLKKISSLEIRYLYEFSLYKNSKKKYISQSCNIILIKNKHTRICWRLIS